MNVKAIRGVLAFAGYVAVIAAFAYLWRWNTTRRTTRPADKVPSHGNYVGTHACRDCHREYYDAYIATAHFATSSEPTRETIRGSFEPGKNELYTRNKSVWFRMVHDETGYYQTVMMRTGSRTVERWRGRFDIVTGSGKRGQTYLYWHNNRLYQLPVSFLAAEEAWTNSPGYRDGIPRLYREIPPGCLECHVTYAPTQTPPRTSTPNDSLLLGISCER
jgi:hypothetical protein